MGPEACFTWNSVQVGRGRRPLRSSEQLAAGGKSERFLQAPIGRCLRISRRSGLPKSPPGGSEERPELLTVPAAVARPGPEKPGRPSRFERCLALRRVAPLHETTRSCSSSILALVVGSAVRGRAGVLDPRLVPMLVNERSATLTRLVVVRGAGDAALGDGH